MWALHTTGIIPPGLWNLTRLTYFSIHHSYITGTIVGSLTNLQLISFNNNEMHGPIPTEFGYLSQLNTLELGT